MDSNQLIEHTQNLEKRIKAYRSPDPYGDENAKGAKAQVCEFLRVFAGQHSSFFREASQVQGVDSYVVKQLLSILKSFSEYVESGLIDGISPERRAQLDVVSDFLEQANRLLEDKKVHPAAATVLIGATLEEFLRTWVETEGFSMGNRKASLTNYADLLREADLITKQDIKDIISWSGIRNHAAHGEWNEVSNKNRITLMLEGVNLFMRKYGI